MKNQNNQLSFRLKISEKEIEEILLRYLIATDQIGENETKFFSALTRHGRSTYVEFIIPQLKNKDENTKQKTNGSVV